jgi:hypothetical protein
LDLTFEHHQPGAAVPESTGSGFFSLPAAAGPADPYGSYKPSAASSSDFFCGVVPGSVLSSVGRAMNLEGAAGLAMKRLVREGLGWVPTAGNLCTLLAFGIAVYLNMYMTGGCRRCQAQLLKVCGCVACMFGHKVSLQHAEKHVTGGRIGCIGCSFECGWVV